MDPFALTPEEEQRIAAEALRAGGVLGDAARRGSRFDNLAAVAPLVNNPAVLKAASAAQQRAVASSKPTSLGNAGFLVDGQLVGNPAALQESLEKRAQQRGLTAERLSQAEALQKERLAQAAEMQRQRLEAQAFQAEQNRALRGALAAMRGVGARPTSTAPGPEEPPKGKPLPISALNKLAPKLEAVDAYESFVSTWKPEYTGPVGAGPALAKATNYVGRYAPIKTGFEEQANWWQNYNAQANIVRNQLFGSALTSAEQRLFEEANITPGMKADMVEKRLGQQAAAARSAAAKLAGTYGKAGYDVSGFAAEAAPAAGGVPSGVDPNLWKHLTPEERKLWQK
jgi:hypothetical protein